jgi:hypothetical protein
MVKKYVVKLSQAERVRLMELVAAAATSVRCRRRARLLLDTDTAGQPGGANDQAIALLRGVSVPTVARVRQLFAVGGVEAVLAAPAVLRERTAGVNPQQVAQLHALAAGPPPAGSHRWSLRQLAGQMVANEYISAISHETVRRVLRKRAAKPAIDN